MAWKKPKIVEISCGMEINGLAIYRFPPKNPPEKPRKHNIWCMRCGKAQYRVEMPMHPTRFMSCGAHRIYGHFSGIATAYCVSQGPSGI